MAEPRKVQFVTLSAFAAGAAAESRKRRLEDEADLNFGRASEVEAATGSGGASSNGRFGNTGDKDGAGAERRATVRLNLSLSEPDDLSSVEFNYGELVLNMQAKNKPPSVTPAQNLHDPFNEDERERIQVQALAKKFKDKYSNTGKKRRKDRMQDLIDIGFGYDETDPFIDNTEAYDELVPASLTTKLGGFYINTGTLQFRAASDSEGDGDKTPNSNKEQEMKKRKKKEMNVLEEKNQKKNRVPKQGVAAHNLHRPEKKKRKKLMKDSLYLAAMLRRFTREKEEMKKKNPNMALPGPAGPEANKSHATNSTNHPLASNTICPQANAAGNDLSLAVLSSDPAVMSLLGSVNEKELQDLLADLDFTSLDTEQQHAISAARENGILGVGVPAHKAAAAAGGGGGGQVRGPGSSSGLFSAPPLPDGLPAPLIKRIEDLRVASRQFDQEGRKKFFTLDMNNILLDIELQVQEQPPAARSDIYSHMEAFVPCNKEALLKRMKKLSLNIQDDRLRTPLLKMKLAVCSVMPEQIARYNVDCMAKVAKQQSGEADKNGSEDEDEEKPGKRVMGPRKKFVWDERLRNLLCSLVRVKLSCYEMENQCSLSVEDYLKAFLENEVKPLWPKGWMQARILLKESLSVHGHLTGSLVKRRMVPGPKVKGKEGLWIHKPPLTMTSSSSLPTSTSTLTSSRQIISSTPVEPICLSDSLDEDLTAPSLDSISHALALLSSASKGLGSSDSPLSPPPLQIPTSSPPPVTPHYPSASQLAASLSNTQHSLSKGEAAKLAAASAGTTTLPISSPTSSSSSSVVSSLARAQSAGSSLSSRTANGPFGQIKGSGAVCISQTQRLVTMASANHRPSLLIGGSGKMHSHPSPTLPKQRPPPTASPLMPPHQKGYVSPVGVLATMGVPQGLLKGSNGSIVVCSSVTPSSSTSSQPRSNSTSHPGTQSFCPPTPLASLPSPTSQTSFSSQGKAHPHHQTNFITPMQATLTKSSHSSNSSPIIKLTPRPPAPTLRPPAPNLRPPAPTLRPPAPTLRPPAPTLRPPAPIPRPPAPTPRSSAAPPRPLVPTPRPLVTIPRSSAPAPRPPAPSPRPLAPTPRPSAPTPRPSAPTPRPPAPTPPPPSSSPSPASSPSQQLSQQLMAGQQHQYTSKTFRPPFRISGGGPLKQSGSSFTGSQKTQSSTSNSSIISNSINAKGAASAACSHLDKTQTTSSAALVSTNHNQRQRMVGGANQSSKAGNGWVTSGTVATSSTTPHLSQVSTAGSSLLGTSTLPLGFGMLGGLVPVSLPFQFPPLLNFSSPGAPGAAVFGSAPSANSGYPLAQSDLMDLYKSLQSGSQTALPPHLQLAFSDANQSQGGEMKRKSH